jgi:hypothetical protein
MNALISFSKLMKELNLISCQQPGHRYKKASKEHVEPPNSQQRLRSVWIIRGDSDNLD